MDLNSTNSASVAKNYESAAEKTKKTGKQEVASAPSYAPEPKEGNESITPKDTVELSDAAEAASEKAKGDSHWKDFDMDAFQGNIRSTLMESINSLKQELRDGGVEFAKYSSDSIIYDLSGLKDSENIKAADVPEYWNAENTSQRIVDFAMSFRSMASGVSDEDYIEQMRAAVEEGYRQAKKALGDLPGPSAKLFNDTYELTMKKFNEFAEQAKNAAGQPS